MLKCRIPAVIIAVAIGGAGLAACGSSASSSTAAAAASASSASPAASPSTSSPTPSPTQTHSAAAKTSSAAEDPPTEGATHSTAPLPHKATSAPASTTSGTHDFTVPVIAGNNIVTGHGSYTKNGTVSVKVTICAQQTGAAFSVGTEALAYNSSGGSQNLGAVILTGPGAPTCVSQTIPFYTAHLKVHAFIGGSKGTIAETGPVLTLY